MRKEFEVLVYEWCGWFVQRFQFRGCRSNYWSVAFDREYCHCHGGYGGMHLGDCKLVSRAFQSCLQDGQDIA